jgi:hypothetical protein
VTNLQNVCPHEAWHPAHHQCVLCGLTVEELYRRDHPAEVLVPPVPRERGTVALPRRYMLEKRRLWLIGEGL